MQDARFSVVLEDVTGTMGKIPVTSVDYVTAPLSSRKSPRSAKEPSYLQHPAVQGRGRSQSSKMSTFGERGGKVYGNSLPYSRKPPVSLKSCQSRSFC